MSRSAREGRGASPLAPRSGCCERTGPSDGPVPRPSERPASVRSGRWHRGRSLGSAVQSAQLGLDLEGCLKSTPTIGVLAAAAVLALVAAPLQARTLSYGGIGATVANFYAANPHGPGKPAPGITYYRVVTRNGRVYSYHVVVGWKSKRNPAELLPLLSGRDLPPDAKAVKPYNGYCAVYRSSWLGHVTGLPYIILYAPHSTAWWNEAMASRVPLCRG
jgi:hypothetical protein